MEDPGNYNNQFLDEEDENFTEELQKLLDASWPKIKADALSKGIPVHYTEYGLDITEYPDGRKEVVNVNMKN